VSCESCSLKLALIDKTVSHDRVIEAVLALDYAPADGEARPRLADFRIALGADAQLVDVVAGPGLSSAQKQLYMNSQTQKPWKRRADGSYQIVAYSTGTSTTFAAGRLLTLRFAYSGMGTPSFALARRLETLAPAAADAALQSTHYDGIVTVTP
jgi:hypothetical protein